MQAVQQSQQHAKAKHGVITSKCKIKLASQKPEEKKKKWKQAHYRKLLNNKHEGGIISVD